MAAYFTGQETFLANDGHIFRRLGDATLGRFVVRYSRKQRSRRPQKSSKIIARLATFD